jgi:hypothetical protein
MDHSTGNGSWSYDADFDNQIIKILRLESRQHGHLRSALDLKHAHRVALTDHIEYRRILRRNRRYGKIHAAMLL